MAHSPAGVAVRQTEFRAAQVLGRRCPCPPIKYSEGHPRVGTYKEYDLTDEAQGFMTLPTTSAEPFDGLRPTLEHVICVAKTSSLWSLNRSLLK